MRKALILALFLGFPPFAFALQPVTDYGAIQVGTMTSIVVTTTPALAYSTGTFQYGPGTSFTAMPVKFSTNANYGGYMDNRVYVEFYNGTSTDVWIGYSNLVSTISGDSNVAGSTGTFYGRQMPPGSAWSHTGQVKDYWVVSATTTKRAFITTQER